MIKASGTQKEEFNRHLWVDILSDNAELLLGIDSPMSQQQLFATDRLTRKLVLRSAFCAKFHMKTEINFEVNIVMLSFLY